jgi:hypothetical protein
MKRATGPCKQQHYTCDGVMMTVLALHLCQVYMGICGGVKKAVQQDA